MTCTPVHTQGKCCYCWVKHHRKPLRTTALQHGQCFCLDLNISLRNVSSPQLTTMSHQTQQMGKKEPQSWRERGWISLCVDEILPCAHYIHNHPCARVDMQHSVLHTHTLTHAIYHSVCKVHACAYSVLNYVVDVCVCTWTFQTCM